MDKYCRDKLDIPVETHGNRFMQIKSMDQFYICVKCNGTGLDHIRSTNGEFTFWSGEDCGECKGLGIFDWIENITCGVKTKLIKREEFNAVYR